MKVHHLNAASLCPRSALLVSGRGGLLKRARLVCHVLLIETSDGLALVDTGLGTGDITHPERLGKAWLRNASPKLDSANTAVAQVKGLGYAAEDVRHILLTHLDRDHAGGLSDFPRAQVHVHLHEYQAAITGEVAVRPGRYINSQWDHRPRWSLYGEPGEDWFGFQGVRALADRETNILIIPLPGHTPGHCGVAVHHENGWLLHAGDSHYSHRQILTPARRPPLGLGYFQWKSDTDHRLRYRNQERLRQLNLTHGKEVKIICSHDPDDFDKCTCSGTWPVRSDQMPVRPQ